MKMTTQPSDISQERYIAKMQAHGFVSDGVLNYWRLPIPGHSICVSDLNAGERRRTKLAYMLKQLSRYEKKYGGTK